MQDESYYRGLVHFVDAEKLAAQFDRITAMPQETRQRQARQVLERFRREFHPAKLFHESGIYEQLDTWLN